MTTQLNYRTLTIVQVGTKMSNANTSLLHPTNKENEDETRLQKTDILLREQHKRDTMTTLRRLSTLVKSTTNYG